MKRKIYCLLLGCCLLIVTGCQVQEPPQVSLDATGPSTTAAVEPTMGTTDTIAVAAESEETYATEAVTVSTEPQATETAQVSTQPSDPPEPSKSEPITPAPIDPTTAQIVLLEPSATVPLETEPPATEPPVAVPPVTDPPETEPAESIDTSELEAYGRAYASGTYGYNGTSACHPGTGAGFFPAATKVITTMDEGRRYVRQAVDSQYKRDMAYGYLPYEEIDGVIVRCPINVSVDSAGDNTYTITVYYGGTA